MCLVLFVFLSYNELSRFLKIEDKCLLIECVDNGVCNKGPSGTQDMNKQFDSSRREASLSPFPFCAQLTRQTHLADQRAVSELTLTLASLSVAIKEPPSNNFSEKRLFQLQFKGASWWGRQGSRSSHHICISRGRVMKACCCPALSPYTESRICEGNGAAHFQDGSSDLINM